MDLKSIATAMRDVNHTVQLGLANSHRATEGAVFEAASEVATELRGLVAAGMPGARTTSALTEEGVALLRDLNTTRGLPNDPVVVGMVANAQTTWRAAVESMDNLLTANGISLTEVSVPRGLAPA